MSSQTLILYTGPEGVSRPRRKPEHGGVPPGARRLHWDRLFQGIEFYAFVIGSCLGSLGLVALFMFNC